MKRLAFLLLAFILSCGPAITRAAAPVPYAWPETVHSWDACLNRFYCRNWELYRHPDDPNNGRIDWLVSVGGRACEITPATAYVIGQEFTCRWRSPRGLRGQG